MPGQAEEKSIMFLRVSYGSSEYPGNFTKKEESIILDNICYRSTSLNLFSGTSYIGDVRIDYNCHQATNNQDVFDFLEDAEKFDVIIIDAPYNQIFADIYQKLGDTPDQFIIFANAAKTTILFNYIDRIDPNIIILKSWNYYCLKRYTIKHCYVCYSGGYRKPTFLIIMKRKQRQLEAYL